MKKFVELIQRVYQERYSVVIQKTVVQKITVASETSDKEPSNVGTSF